MWLPFPLSLLYESLSPGWHIDVPTSARRTSVRYFVMLPGASILSRVAGIYAAYYFISNDIPFSVGVNSGCQGHDQHIYFHVLSKRS